MKIGKYRGTWSNNNLGINSSLRITSSLRINSSLGIWIVCALAVGAMHSAIAKEVNTEISLKNLYADRDYDQQIPSLGNWSQGAMAKVNAAHALNKTLDATFTGSAQYAHRLSESKSTDDAMLPFDRIQRKQALHYNKLGASIGLKYRPESSQSHELSWGEQWLNTPLATGDTSRQLATFYQGWVYRGSFEQRHKLELARINRISPRNQGVFQPLSVKNVKTEALNYINVNLQPDPKLKLNLYYGNLMHLYDQFSLGLNFQQPVDDLLFNTKFRFYSSFDTGNAKLGSIDNQYYGVLQDVKRGNTSFGIGYQKIAGKGDFPKLDGYVPVLDFINWTQGIFGSANEQSWHFVFNHHLDWLLPNLNLSVKYIRGDDFAVRQRQDAKESELATQLSYLVKEGYLKGLDLRWININYDNNYGRSYVENRIITSYSFKF